jgi:2-isopropylmalate synthase
MSKLEIYDTTLRDGSQGEGISFSLEDKLKILKCLDDFRMDFVEGGWPGSNPKDIDFFKAARDVPLKHARVAAFGSTCRAGAAAEDDANLRALLEVRTPVVAIFGKSWKLHVTQVVRTTPEENLRMIEDSVRLLRSHDREVLYDAEHFFDGYVDDPAYALETLVAAQKGGARVLVLCDTNGGTLPRTLGAIVDAIREQLPGASLGIHTHNDSGVATANTLEAVERGAMHVQGTFNGLGERCGNADLANIIPNLVLKMGKTLSVDSEKLTQLTHTARYISTIANRAFPENHAYVGRMAFAHKGGVHVNSVMKHASTYEHVSPERVGNSRRVLMSELAGRANIKHLAAQVGLDIDAHPTAAAESVQEIKRLENQGYVFEGAEASSALIILKSLGRLPSFFDLIRYRVTIEHRSTGGTVAEATVKVRVGDAEHPAVGEGVGPVDALDNGLRRALQEFYPEVHDIVLNDYRVRMINTAIGTDAKVCVFIESIDTQRDVSWGTVGAGENIIEASWTALRDSIIYGLWRKRRKSQE